MQNLKNLVLALHNDEDGATATEYIVLLVLIAVLVIGIISLFGSQIDDLFKNASDEVDQIDISHQTSGYVN